MVFLEPVGVFTELQGSPVLICTSNNVLNHGFGNIGILFVTGEFLRRVGFTENPYSRESVLIGSFLFENTLKQIKSFLRVPYIFGNPFLAIPQVRLYTLLDFIYMLTCLSRYGQDKVNQYFLWNELEIILGEIQNFFILRFQRMQG